MTCQPGKQRSDRHRAQNDLSSRLSRRFADGPGVNHRLGPNGNGLNTAQGFGICLVEVIIDDRVLWQIGQLSQDFVLDQFGQFRIAGRGQRQAEHLDARARQADEQVEMFHLAIVYRFRQLLSDLFGVDSGSSGTESAWRTSISRPRTLATRISNRCWCQEQATTLECDGFSRSIDGHQGWRSRVSRWDCGQIVRREQRTITSRLCLKSLAEHW